MLLKSSLKSLKIMIDRHKVHTATVEACLNLFSKFGFKTTFRFRDSLNSRILGYDLVVTVGGDGTILDTSHFLDGNTPLLGINSDPTDPLELAEVTDFDATRSKGHLCAATVQSLEKDLTSIMEGRVDPLRLTRISTLINGKPCGFPALNDVLIAHPCPACVSRFSFGFMVHNSAKTEMFHTRSSGFRVCTATGSTAAMKSSGGYPMDIVSKSLQYKVREPLDPQERSKPVLHGFVEGGKTIILEWGNRKGKVFIDGSHVSAQIALGDVVELSPNAPPLLMFNGKLLADIN